MVKNSLTDAFNDCIDRLNAGQSIDDCLRAYPMFADELRPMLTIGLTITHAAPAISATARQRVGQRIMQEAARIPAQPPRRFGSSWLSAAALLAIVTAAVVTLMWLNRDDRNIRLQVEPLHPTTITPTASATESLSPSPSWAATLTIPPTATLAPRLRETSTSTPTRTPTNPPPRTPQNTSVRTPSPDPSRETALSACEFEVTVSSVRLRSGPGTGYMSLGFGEAGEAYLVTETITDGSWLNVTSDQGNVWVAANLGTLTGNCATLPISDQPYRPAPTNNLQQTVPAGGNPQSPDGISPAVTTDGDDDDHGDDNHDDHGDNSDSDNSPDNPDNDHADEEGDLDEANGASPEAVS